MPVDNAESNKRSETVQATEELPASYTAVPADLLLRFTEPAVAFTTLYAGRSIGFGIRERGQYTTCRELVTPELYRRHLADPDPEAWSLGIVPIREDDRCTFGGIDFDRSGLTDEEALAIAQRSAFAGLPLVWALSKSRGLHGALFLAESQSAEDVRRMLHHWAVTHLGWKPKEGADTKADGVGFFEIFPKQDTVAAGGVGNFINLPWSGGNDSPRYGFNAARRLRFTEWLAHAWAWRIDGPRFAVLAAAVAPGTAPIASSETPPPKPRGKTPTLAEARACLRDLDPARWEDYGGAPGAGGWLDIGMVLHETFDGSDDALALWDEFSRGSSKYDAEICAAKWNSFSAERGRRQTFASLVKWANADRAVVAKDVIAEAIAEYNRRWGLVLCGGNAVLETPPHGLPRFHEFNRWRRFEGNKLVEVPTATGVKTVPLVDVWLGDARRRSYHGVVFDPSRAPYAGVPAQHGDDDDQDFNLWPGLALTPSAAGSCARFLDHLRVIICRDDPVLYQWVVMWLAHIVQHPGTLVGTALALRGPQGTGKTVVGEVMGTMLGGELYAKVSKPGELTGRFNSHHKGRLLLQVEEAFWAGDKQAEAALKHMVTSPEIMIEPKFVDAFAVRNFVRLLITSNRDWVVPAGFGERRFAVLDVSETRKDDRAYFGALREEMFRDGGCERFLHHLLHEVVVEESVIWRPPVTEALSEQKLGSLGDHDEWLLSILTRGSLPGDLTGTGVAPTETIFKDYVDRGRDLHRGRRSSETALGVYVRRNSPLGKGAVTNARIHRRNCYVFPPLAECRARFAAKFGHEIEWLDPTTTWLKSSDEIV